ncbi:MAG: hypothetical protein K0S12_26 [Bacteroidetes bacterium]|jgi:hypothetical protein|nr:hypothetical protein [Bacteroidota bacterium]
MFEILLYISYLIPFVIILDFKKRIVTGIIYVLAFYVLFYLVSAFALRAYHNLWLLLIPISLPFLVLLRSALKK